MLAGVARAAGLSFSARLLGKGEALFHGQLFAFDFALLTDLVSLLNLVAAAAVLWYAAQTRRVRQTALSQYRSVVEAQSRSAESAVSSEAIRAILDRLRALAESAAHDVGAHNARVETVNRQLSKLPSAGNDPLQASLLAAAQQMLEGNRHLLTELAKTKAELQDHAKRAEAHMTEARTDALTGLPNRRAFDEEIAQRYAAWRLHGTSLALVMIDIDFFKKLNDAHGHRAGDEALRVVGRTLAASVRGMDVVARYGGEEFAVLIPSSTAKAARLTAERIRAAVAKTTFFFEGKSLEVTLSAGVAELRASDTESSLVQRADAALYAAKSNGRNRVFYHDGAECLPVDLPSVAVASDAASARGAPCDGARTNKQRKSERRAHPRYPFSRTQCIAPLVDHQFPPPEMFQEIRCQDISSGGFSFELSEPPGFSMLVLALGPEGNAKHLIAAIVRTRKVEQEGTTVCIVGAHFIGKFDANGVATFATPNDGSRNAAIPLMPTPPMPLPPTPSLLG